MRSPARLPTGFSSLGGRAMKRTGPDSANAGNTISLIIEQAALAGGIERHRQGDIAFPTKPAGMISAGSRAAELSERWNFAQKRQ